MGTDPVFRASTCAKTENRLHLSSSGKNTSKVPKVYPITVSFKETRHRKRPRRGSLDVG